MRKDRTKLVEALQSLWRVNPLLRRCSADMGICNEDKRSRVGRDMKWRSRKARHVWRGNEWYGEARVMRREAMTAVR